MQCGNLDNLTQVHVLCRQCRGTFTKCILLQKYHWLYGIEQN